MNMFKKKTKKEKAATEETTPAVDDAQDEAADKLQEQLDEPPGSEEQPLHDHPTGWDANGSEVAAEREALEKKETAEEEALSKAHVEAAIAANEKAKALEAPAAGVTGEHVPGKHDPECEACKVHVATHGHGCGRHML